MTIERIESGPRLSRAVVHGGAVSLTGQVARDPTLDASGQTEDVPRQIDDLLGIPGTDRSRLLSVQIVLKDIAVDFAAVSVASVSWIAGLPAPARAPVQDRLAAQDLLVEIVATAARRPDPAAGFSGSGRP